MIIDKMTIVEEHKLVRPILTKEEFFALKRMLGNMSLLDMMDFCSHEEAETVQRMYFQMHQTIEEAKQ